MNKRVAFGQKVEELKSKFLDEIAPSGWSFIDEKYEEGAIEFISRSLDVLQSLHELIKKEFGLKTKHPEESLASLYQTKRLEMDYSELVPHLKDLETSADYERLLLDEDEAAGEIEDIMSEIENLFDALLKMDEDGKL